jgi:RimJ/RimL family protein N-acetyltransferase
MDVPPAVPTLSDGVVALRSHTRDDLPDIVGQCRDPLMQRWTTVPAPYGESDAEEFLASRPVEWAAGRSLAFAVTDPQGRYAGTVDLRPDGAAAHIGYGFAPWARGRGLAGRAVRLLLGWGFDTLDLEVVHWRALLGNWPSRRLAWAVGFRVEGVVRGLLPARLAAGAGPPRLDGWVGSLRRGDPMHPSHTWHTPPALGDSTVRLREHRDDDVARMVQACADPLTQAWLPALPAPYSEINALAHLEEIRAHHADGVAIYWAVCPPADDTLLAEVGVFGLTPDATARSVEVGYWTHPDSRGRGVTVAALRLVVRHALLPADDGGLGVQRVLVRAAEGNHASRRVAEKAGLRPCGRDREVELLRDGTTCDLIRFDAVATEQVTPR